MKGTFEQSSHGGKKSTRKGVLNQKTKDWDELRDYIIGKGAKKYMDALTKLPDDTFMARFENVLNYFKPKHSTAQIEQEIKGETIVRIIRDTTENITSSTEENN